MPQTALGNIFPGIQNVQPVFDGERAFGSMILTFCLYNGGKDPENLGGGTRCNVLSKQGREK